MPKTALISGGARGIGRVTAMRLLLDGWNVAITYHASKELAEAFQFETSPLLAVMHQAVLERQPEQLGRAAHNLKGSSHNLGARRMASLSAELETLGKSGTVEGASELVTRLEQEYQRVCQALSTEGAEIHVNR